MRRSMGPLSVCLPSPGYFRSGISGQWPTGLGGGRMYELPVGTAAAASAAASCAGSFSSNRSHGGKSGL
jgi:hypothetical protein